MKKVGADYLQNGKCRFTVWAPTIKNMQLHLVHPADKLISMQQDDWGYFVVEVEDVYPGCEYFFIPEGKKDFPDPASSYQSKGVHGPSCVVDHHSYQWKDVSWPGLPFQDFILYELHVGTFTNEGTFEAIIPFLDDLVQVGINAIELMPVCQFPGNRNWGYDGVYPYAVHNSYGGPEGLKRLVDACHEKGIAVLLDVVYNHLGPEGNYFPEFGPYFTDKYKVPWGDALNFDGKWSDGVREYFVNNALYWFEHYHIDGLRLDAIHAIYDHGAIPIWEMLYSRIKQLEQQTGRVYFTIAESDLNNPKVIKNPETGGYGFTAQWLDDFHHALYVLLHAEGRKLYEDFGAIEQLAKAYTDGFVHSGEYVNFRKAMFGRSSAGVPGNKFVVFTDNHDQAGNRVTGARLSSLIDHERLKMAVAGMMMAPYVPMLFMGEEYADDAPFYYFVSHSDEKLIKAVREGRKKEFEAFKWENDPLDPQDEETFRASKLNWSQRGEGEHALMLGWYTELIALRKKHPALQNFNKNDVRAYPVSNETLLLHRRCEQGTNHLLALFNFSEKESSAQIPAIVKTWKKVLDSKDEAWISEQGNQGFESPATIEGGQMISLPPVSVLIYGNSQ